MDGRYIPLSLSLFIVTFTSVTNNDKVVCPCSEPHDIFFTIMTVTLLVKRVFASHLVGIEKSHTASRLQRHCMTSVNSTSWTAAMTTCCSLFLLLSDDYDSAGTVGLTPVTALYCR